MKRVLRILLLIAFLIMAVSHPYSGESEDNASLTLRSATTSSKAIVTAKVISSHTSDPKNNGILYTTYNFETSKLLKGHMERKFQIRCVGGENSDGSGMAASDSFKFSKGRSYLLFLAPKFEISLSPVLRAFSVNEWGMLADENGASLNGIRDDGSFELGPPGEFEALHYGTTSESTVKNAPPPGKFSPNGKGCIVSTRSTRTTTEANLKAVLETIDAYSKEAD